MSDEESGSDHLLAHMENIELGVSTKLYIIHHYIFP